MQNRTKLFVESPMLGGYTLSVRDDWSYKIKHVNITANEKIEYEKTFGDEIITYDEFFNWWKELNKIEKTKNKTVTIKKETASQSSGSTDNEMATEEISVAPTREEEEILGIDSETPIRRNSQGGVNIIL